MRNIAVYAVMAIFSCAITLVRSRLEVDGSIGLSNAIHSEVVERVLNVSVEYLMTHPSRALKQFNSDLSRVDMIFSVYLIAVFRGIFFLISLTVILGFYMKWYSAFWIIPAVFVQFLFKKYRKANIFVYFVYNKMASDSKMA